MKGTAFGCCSCSLSAGWRVSMKDLCAGFMGSCHRMPVWEYKKLGVGCVWRVSGVRVVRFRGSCLIIYLYNLQKMGLAERGGPAFYKPPWEYSRSRAVFLATSAILCLKKWSQWINNLYCTGSSVLVACCSRSTSHYLEYRTPLCPWYTAVGAHASLGCLDSGEI